MYPSISVSFDRAKERRKMNISAASHPDENPGRNFAARARATGSPAESNYRRLFETAQDGILILNASSGQILDANPFMERLVGRAKSDFLGKELWQIGVAADIDANRAAFRSLQKNGYVRYEHLPLATKAGDAVDVEFVSNIYEAGGVKVAQCNIRDITDRRRLEKQVLKQAEALADLNHRKDEFFAMLSHELRNPLSAILNAVHLLRHEACELALREKAGAILERQVQQLTLRIDELLELARVTTGQLQLRRERVDLRSVIENAVETVRPIVARRKHELTLTLPSEPLWLNVDPSRVEQVVVNLLINAAKYALEAGHIALTVGQEGNEVVIRVRDSGIGISAKLLPHVFELFTRADKALHRSEAGLGIGLTVVKRLVEMHGGTVVASSPGLGQGSEFIVRLPALSIAEPRSSTPNLPLVAAAPGKTRRLLVVDDDIDSADSLAELLRLFGHDVRVAYTGLSAIETVTAYPPDAVLMDIGLTGLSGYEIAARLRHDPKVEINSVCLIATTGYGMRSDRLRIRKAGFDHHLVKPVDPRRLQHLVAHLGS
jgi:PAS domain S-box-containing protein